ncbi:MAG TPA: hypothetical protein VGK67_24200 [Myxococcales bacterium]|jgi:hypothetical protein
MARRTPSDQQHARELEKRSTAFAEGLNCLAIALCANSLRIIQEKYGVKDIRETLARSAEVCLDFVTWLLEHGRHAKPGVDLQASADAFGELRAMLEDPASIEPGGVDLLRLTIRRASKEFGMELPAHPMSKNGVCEYHGEVCPPAEPQLVALKTKP